MGRLDKFAWVVGLASLVAASACGAGGESAARDAMSDAVPQDAGAPDSGVDAGTLPTRFNATSPLGTNLSSIRDWVPSWPFVDVFKTSRGWISGSASAWSDGRSIDVDSGGWVRSLLPGQIARALMLWSNTHFPEGQFIVLYDGAGTLQYRQGATLDVAASSAGRDVVDFSSSRGGFLMNLTSTESANPLRNIRVIMPGGVCSGDALAYCDATTACVTGTCESFEDGYATQRRRWLVGTFIPWTLGVANA